MNPGGISSTLRPCEIPRIVFVVPTGLAASPPSPAPSHGGRVIAPEGVYRSNPILIHRGAATNLGNGERLALCAEPCEQITEYGFGVGFGHRRLRS